MAVKHVDLDDCYVPKSSDKEIVVKVEIGDGQDGSYSVFLGTSFIVANAPARLGKKADIMGKSTIVSAIVVDVLQETNWTSMTVLVTEGSGKPTKFGPYKTQAETHLDTVIYTLKLIHQ
ncbi:MAG TPA: hypothetical protein VMR70_13895 [Flavisolibacter sp.]|nr:hypothetical protein [Flavisolibacter sp.]